MNKYLIKSEGCYLCKQGDFIYWSKFKDSEEFRIKFCVILIDLYMIFMKLVGYDKELEKVIEKSLELKQE